MTILLALSLSPAALAAAAETAALDYARTGFDPGAEDQAPRGAELLAAGPGGALALFNPVDAELVVLGADLSIASAFPVGWASALAWTGAGELVVLDHSARTLHLYDTAGARLDSQTLPAIVPVSARIAVRGGQVFVLDPFDNLHRAAGVAPGALTDPEGPALVEGDHRVVVIGDTIVADGHIYSLSGSLRASGQVAGARWFILDQIVDEAPLRAIRTAIDLETGEEIALPVEGRAYTPRVDFAEDEQGRLIVLDPGPDALRVLRWTP